MGFFCFFGFLLGFVGFVVGWGWVFVGFWWVLRVWGGLKSAGVKFGGSCVCWAKARSACRARVCVCVCCSLRGLQLTSKPRARARRTISAEAGSQRAVRKCARHRVSAALHTKRVRVRVACFLLLAAALTAHIEAPVGQHLNLSCTVTPQRAVKKHKPRTRAQEKTHIRAIALSLQRANAGADRKQQHATKQTQHTTPTAHNHPNASTQSPCRGPRTAC